ncbi:MAG: hypothetical protein ACLFP8_03730 [Alphaproteobacteria bacterium]
MKKKGVALKKLLFLVIVSVFSFVMSARAQPPVVVEYFSMEGCSRDVVIQQKLYEISKTQENVIFVNCPLGNLSGISASALSSEDEQDGNDFFNDVCLKRARAHSQRLDGKPAFMLSVVVNGKWDANAMNSLPAVNLGRNDDVRSLDLSREDNMLRVILPEGLGAEDIDSALRLFVYGANAGLDSGAGDDVSLQQEAEGVFALGKIMDDVNEFLDQAGQDESAATSFHPFVAMEEIGIWDGSQSDYDVSLETVIPDVDMDLGALGYVVVLERGSDLSGEIIAAGEIVPDGERALPNSPEGKVD